MTYTIGTEVASFPEGSQFEGGESPNLCVFFGVADIAASSTPGSPPGQSWEWVDEKADSLANHVQGAKASLQSQGASLPDEYQALKICGLSFFPISVNPTLLLKSSIENIKQAINAGMLVLLTGEESGFIDSQINQVPYSWRPLENHCLVVSGYDSEDNLIVRDYASVGHPWKPGSRRIYLSQSMKLISATAVIPYWHGDSKMIPTGWKDENEILTAPNGVIVVKGFRDEILKGSWSSDNWPISVEYGVDQCQEHNLSIGKGTRQEFFRNVLWWNEKDGVTNEPNLGSECHSLYAIVSQLQSQIGSSKIPDNVQKFISNISVSMKKFSDSVSSSGFDSTVIPALINLISEISSEVESIK